MNIKLTRMVDNEETNGRIYQDFSFNEFFFQGLLVEKSGQIEEPDQEVEKERILHERKMTRSRKEQSNYVDGYDEPKQVIHIDCLIYMISDISDNFKSDHMILMNICSSLCNKTCSVPML